MLKNYASSFIGDIFHQYVSTFPAIVEQTTPVVGYITVFQDQQPTKVPSYDGQNGVTYMADSFVRKQTDDSYATSAQFIAPFTLVGLGWLDFIRYTWFEGQTLESWLNRQLSIEELDRLANAGQLTYYTAWGKDESQSKPPRFEHFYAEGPSGPFYNNSRNGTGGNGHNTTPYNSMSCFGVGRQVKTRLAILLNDETSEDGIPWELRRAHYWLNAGELQYPSIIPGDQPIANFQWIGNFQVWREYLLKDKIHVDLQAAYERLFDRTKLSVPDISETSLEAAELFELGTLLVEVITVVVRCLHNPLKIVTYLDDFLDLFRKRTFVSRRAKCAHGAVHLQFMRYIESVADGIAINFNWKFAISPIIDLFNDMQSLDWDAIDQQISKKVHTASSTVRLAQYPGGTPIKSNGFPIRIERGTMAPDDTKYKYIYYADMPSTIYGYTHMRIAYRYKSICRAIWDSLFGFSLLYDFYQVVPYSWLIDQLSNLGTLVRQVSSDHDNIVVLDAGTYESVIAMTDSTPPPIKAVVKEYMNPPKKAEKHTLETLLIKQGYLTRDEATGSVAISDPTDNGAWCVLSNFERKNSVRSTTPSLKASVTLLGFENAIQLLLLNYLGKNKT